MLVLLVVFCVAVASEAGVIHQHHTGDGLNYHQFKSYPVRFALGRPYIYPPIGRRPAPVPSFVFNSVPFNHAITPITVTRVASPLLQPPTSITTKVLSTAGSAPLSTLSNHIQSTALNSLPINAAIQQSAYKIPFLPAIDFINQPETILSAPVGPPLLASSVVPPITSSYATVNVKPEKAISYSLSHQDYEYLKRHKVEGKDSPYNPIPGFNTSPGNEKHQNSHSHHNKDDKALVNKPDRKDSESALKRSTALNSGIQGSGETNFIQSNNGPSLIQGNSESSFTHTHEEQTTVLGDSGPSLINIPGQVTQSNGETSFLEHGNNELNLIQGNSETNFIQGNSGSINIEGDSGPGFINLPQPVIQGNSETNLIQGNSGSINIEGDSGPSFINLPQPVIQGNIETSFIQQGSNELNLIQGNQGSSFSRGNSVPTFNQGNVEPSYINVAEPLVSKHIYFHVPPPDFEESPRVPITNLSTPKKTYNILFIKAPSQDQNNVYLQQLLQSRQNQVEDKTLIYVLSKKEDPVEVVLPHQETSKVSSPEVYFVKYKTKLGDISDVSNEHAEQSLVESISSSLSCQ